MGRVSILGAFIVSTMVMGASSSARVQEHTPVFRSPVQLHDPSRYPASAPHYGGQLLPDAEPSIAIGSDGAIWVTALHMQYGTALWHGYFGMKTPQFVGMPDHGLGGKDATVAVGTGRRGALYTASLSQLPGQLGRHITMASCPRGRVDATFRLCHFYPHLALGQRDRPWLASSGAVTVYISYLTLGNDTLAGHMTVQRSDDGGVTWLQVGDPVADLPPGVHGWPGPVVVDSRTGTVYEIFVTETAGRGPCFNRLVIAVSRDRGVTWHDKVVYAGREDMANMWPALAVDGGGRLYVSWSTRRHVYVSWSDGVAWSSPQALDRPSLGMHVHVMPWVATGKSGRVSVAWYASSLRDNLATTARWRVAYAESSDGGASFQEGMATGVVYQGPICTKGDACAWIDRQLLDNFGMAIDPQSGHAAIVYSSAGAIGDYRACRRAPNCPQTYYVEEHGP